MGRKGKKDNIVKFKFDRPIKKDAKFICRERGTKEKSPMRIV